MADRDNDTSRNQLAGPKPGTYSVGYAKPPVEHRFKPGRSGNPRGRPRGSKNKVPALHEERLKTIVLEEAYRSITVNDGGQPVTIPIAQAIIRALAVNAARGNARAQRLFTEMLTTTERENRKLHEELVESVITYKAKWENEFARRELTGTTGPDPLPHPDHVVVDMRTGEVSIEGPMTKEEKDIWDKFIARKALCDRTIAELEQLLADEPDYPHKDFVLRDLEFERNILAIIKRSIPDWAFE